jgi:hypothetical protein
MLPYQQRGDHDEIRPVVVERLGPCYLAPTTRQVHKPSLRIHHFILYLGDHYLSIELAHLHIS